jgi:6-pyruvoyltetrahydropterin/6-carboxytetrahydropterin synthase
MARRISFSSAHFYNHPKFSKEKNERVFGRCFTEHGHGHNYILEAFLEGPINAQTGLLVNIIDIDKVLHQVVDPLDHQHLNFDIPYFKSRIPTTEAIAQYCYREVAARLATAFPGVEMKLYKVRLYEMDDLYVEYAE